jgi:hypothetical protein
MNWSAHFRRRSAGIVSTPEFGRDPSFGIDSGTMSQVQAKINSLGYTPALAVDGQDGPKTQAGVKWYQAANGLSVDGKVGPQTLGRMGIAVTGGDNLPAGLVPGLKDAVVQAIPSFFGKFEGAALPYMYTDSKGLVTTGTGNLIDPISVALALPWKNQDGSLASPDQVTAAWNTVKSAYPGVQSVASQKLTTIRLDKNAINSLILKTVKNNHSYLSRIFPGYTDWPADAQMVVHSLAWAWGPGFASVWGPRGQDFKTAVNQNPPDFRTAANVVTAASAHEESINPGIRPRNAAGVKLFQNAADVVEKNADPNRLWYPGDVILTALESGAKNAAIGIGIWVGGGLAFLAGLAGYEYWKGLHHGK